MAGNDGTDTVFGRIGNDILIGGLGQDIANGNEGGDALVGFGALLDLAADRNAPGYGPDLN